MTISFPQLDCVSFRDSLGGLPDNVLADMLESMACPSDDPNSPPPVEFNLSVRTGDISPVDARRIKLMGTKRGKIKIQSWNSRPRRPS